MADQIVDAVGPSVVRRSEGDLLVRRNASQDMGLLYRQWDRWWEGWGVFHHAVDFAVDFRADEKDQGVEVEEEEDDGDAADGAVGAVILAELVDVEAKGCAQDEPGDDGKDCAGAEEYEALFDAGAEFVERHQGGEHEEYCQYVAENIDSPYQGGRKKIAVDEPGYYAGTDREEDEDEEDQDHHDDGESDCDGALDIEGAEFFCIEGGVEGGHGH